MSVFYYKNNKLYCEDVCVDEIVSKVGVPLYLYSKNKILQNLRSYQKGLSDYKNIICYAIKANSNLSILKLLAENNCGADITSGGELYRSIKAGFEPKKMVYAGVGKTEQEIRYGIKTDILMFNVESVEELELINKIAGSLKKKVRIALRINPDVLPKTHRYITTGKAKTKFGIPYPDALRVYKYASKLKNLKVVGIHSHIGSQITTIKPFVDAARKIKNIVKELEKIDIKLTFIDLGGGLGIKYKDENPPTPDVFVREVLGVFDNKDYIFIFEPGRSIVGESGALIGSVLYRKKVLDKNYLIVDIGMSDLIRPTLYEAYHEIIPTTRSSCRLYNVDIVGPICETGDFLGKERMLPWLKVGQYVAVLCAGAYGFAMSSQYNSRCRAAEVLVDGCDWKVIRNRENYEDLIQNEIIL